MDTENTRPGNGIPAGVDIAGLGARSYAFIIDWHVRAMLALLWVLLADYFDGNFDLLGVAAGASIRSPWLLVAPAAAIYFLYHPVVELVLRGSTPGKRAAGIRIVTTANTTPGPWPLLVRNLLRVIDCLPFAYLVGIVAVIMTPTQVRIGDMAASTLLVYTAEDASTDADVGTLLLRRWPELDAETRVRLARMALARYGRQVPTGLTGAALEAALHRELNRLVYSAGRSER